MNLPRIAETPGVMRTTGWGDYALLDSGRGRKLERYGPYRVVRPEPQAMWAPRLPVADWNSADAVFDPTDDDEAGNWRFRERLAESWPLGWGDVKFQGRFTAFRHLAFVPEQAANWAWLDQAVVKTPPVIHQGDEPGGVLPRGQRLRGEATPAPLVLQFVERIFLVAAGPIPRGQRLHSIGQVRDEDLIFVVDDLAAGDLHPGVDQ